VVVTYPAFSKAFLLVQTGTAMTRQGMFRGQDG